jgi:starch phosphorylase
MHQQTLQNMWRQYPGICQLIAITNAQHFDWWHDAPLYEALQAGDDVALQKIKRQHKRTLFDIVADQCGEIYDENICTIVFAKRFAGYKRPDLFFHDMERFARLVTNTKRPVQIIWAGKPYPMDYNGIGIFDKIADICKMYFNCAILVGYELGLSRHLKRGADVWLNVPRLTHEASGTSGMVAAMNGAVNVGLPDGWFPEFAKDKINSFVIPPCDSNEPEHLQDELDAASLYNLLENEVLPMYYDYPDRWLEIVKKGMTDIVPAFGSNRMAKEYYERLYTTVQAKD